MHRKCQFRQPFVFWSCQSQWKLSKRFLLQNYTYMYRISMTSMCSSMRNAWCQLWELLWLDWWTPIIVLSCCWVICGTSPQCIFVYYYTVCLVLHAWDSIETLVYVMTSFKFYTYKYRYLPILIRIGSNILMLDVPLQKRRW